MPQRTLRVESTDVVHDAREAPNGHAHVPRRLDNEDFVGLGAEFEHHRGVVPLRVRVGSDQTCGCGTRFEEQKVKGVSQLEELLL